MVQQGDPAPCSQSEGHEANMDQSESVRGSFGKNIQIRSAYILWKVGRMDMNFSNWSVLIWRNIIIQRNHLPTHCLLYESSADKKYSSIQRGIKMELIYYCLFLIFFGLLETRFDPDGAFPGLASSWSGEEEVDQLGDLTVYRSVCLSGYPQYPLCFYHFPMQIWPQPEWQVGSLGPRYLRPKLRANQGILQQNVDRSSLLILCVCAVTWQSWVLCPN